MIIGEFDKVVDVVPDEDPVPRRRSEDIPDWVPEIAPPQDRPEVGEGAWIS